MCKLFPHFISIFSRITSDSSSRRYVDTQLRTSKRFDADGLERDHPELFKPLPRRYSRTSSSVSLASSLDGGIKKMTPLSSLNDTLKRQTSGEYVKKSEGDEGQLRYWTNEMCTTSPHLFDFVVTVSPLTLQVQRSLLLMQNATSSSEVTELSFTLLGYFVSLLSVDSKRGLTVRFLRIRMCRSSCHSLRPRLARIPYKLRLLLLCQYAQ